MSIGLIVCCKYDLTRTMQTTTHAVLNIKPLNITFAIFVIKRPT